MARRTPLAGLLATLALLIGLGGPAAAYVDPPSRLLFSNPVLGQGQDPSIVVDRGRYYYVQTSPDATYLTVRTSRSIKSLGAAPKHVVWRAVRAGSPCCDWWAPELVQIGSAWYIYVAADNGSNSGHRLRVLRATNRSGPTPISAS